VKRLEDGSPVFFLENGLYRKGDDFREEMLRHLQEKAKKMDPKPLVMDQIRGKIREEDPWVFGTGAYTEHEYVEPVFGLRRSSNIKHHGRIFGMASEESKKEKIKGPIDSPPFAVSDSVSVMGIGTSNRKWVDYVAALKTQGVKVLIDVRANPQSQYFPHFNRRHMTESLEKEGIEYIWMGDVLGNPKDAHGNRTLEGFQSYMKTKSYERGLAGLIEILKRTEGKVALTCAEGAEEACHRKFILEDLKRHF